MAIRCVPPHPVPIPPEEEGAVVANVRLLGQSWSSPRVRVEFAFGLKPPNPLPGIKTGDDVKLSFEWSVVRRKSR